MFLVGTVVWLALVDFAACVIFMYLATMDILRTQQQGASLMLLEQLHE